MVNSLRDINSVFCKYRVFLSFSGPLSQDLTVEMGEILKTKMKLEGATISTILKVFSIMVEVNHNIIHYSAEKAFKKGNSPEGGKTGCGIITIGQDKDTYYLMAGNLIEKERISKIKESLDKLIHMDRHDLKKYYKEKRKQGPDSESKGAGLGFIEIARKVSRPLEYDFRDVENDLAFFSLKTIV